MSNTNTELREDGLYVWCYREKAFKPENEFYKYQNINTIYFKNCKSCGSYNSTRVENEKILSTELLKSIGYDVYSQIPVHEQFNKRHNL